MESLAYVPQRDGYGKGLLQLCQEQKNILVLDADVSASTRTAWVREQYPEKFINVGISEQDLVGTAAGLALGGITPFVSTYGVFLSGRAWDQIRTTVCYNNLNVKFGGAHAGISVGPDGATHQALEDIAITRVLPNMTVLAPCDWLETKKAVLAAEQWPGPVYIRFGREAVPTITQKETPFQIGKARVLCQGTDVAFLACGAMVYHAQESARILSKEGISCHVVDLHTIKPLDEACILDCAKRCGAVVTAEEHQLAGGMGSAVAEFLALHYPVPMEMVGVRDCFGQSGQPGELMEQYGLTFREITQSARKVLARKREG